MKQVQSMTGPEELKDESPNIFFNKKTLWIFQTLIAKQPRKQ